jgi:hypothetical protein
MELTLHPARLERKKMAVNSRLRYTDLVRLASRVSLFPKWF